MQKSSDIVSHAEMLASQGAAEQAYRLLERASASGDARAALTIAEWRLSGQIVRRDLKLARDFYGKAAALGVDFR